jgi:hypothetical protein
MTCGSEINSEAGEKKSYFVLAILEIHLVAIYILNLLEHMFSKKNQRKCT